MITTPEQVEAIPATDYKAIVELASSLHESTPAILDLDSPHDIADQEVLRTQLKLKIDEAISEIDKEISDKEALKKGLRIAKGYQSSDCKRLESRKINLYIIEKQLRNRP